MVIILQCINLFFSHRGLFDILIRIQADTWRGLDPQEAGYQRIQAAGDQGGTANHKTIAHNVIIVFIKSKLRNMKKSLRHDFLTHRN